MQIVIIEISDQLWFIGIWLDMERICWDKKSCGAVGDYIIVLAVGHQKVNPNDFLEAKSSDL